MKVRFFTICYGDKFASMFERVLLRSMLQPRNAAAIPGDATIVVYGDDATLGRMNVLAGRLGINVESRLIHKGHDVEEALCLTMIDEIARCVAAGAAMIPFGPDAFWGDGSLANLLAIAGERRVCVAAPHVRVDEAAFMKTIDFAPWRVYGNPELVGLAMRTLHPAAKAANADLQQNNSYATALSIKEIGPGMWSVGCLLQTCWLAKFEASDLEFFGAMVARGITRGINDHIWPEKLVREERHRSIGSSDAFFLAELTDTKSHISPVYPRDPASPDAYHRRAPHISANRNVQAIWRAEPGPLHYREAAE